MRTPGSAQRLLRVGAVVLPAVLLGLLAWSHRWVADDGFIDLHIADNLLKGLGPVFNAGERVESYTSPLWVGLLALVGIATKLFWAGEGGRPPFEWIAVSLGLICSMSALVLAGLAADRLQNPPRSEPEARDRAADLPFPFGTLVVLAIIPFWDYTTSGLETSLCFLWLALVFWACVRILRGSHGSQPGAGLGAQLWTAFAIGMGVLVRPDLGIFSLVFGTLIVARSEGWGRRAALLSVMLALPVGYQIFRMGYFGCLVPNTALAKEAGLAYWSHGWIYLKEFEVTYQLWIPLLLLTAAEGMLAGWLSESEEQGRALLAGCSWFGGMAYGLYITRVGGDFLHGRMLLPAVFALMLPVATLPFPRFKWLALSMLTWGMLCFSIAQIPLDKDGPGIERGRLNFILLSKNPHPVTLDDYAKMGWIEDVDGLFQKMAEARANDARLERAKFYSSSGHGAPRWADLQPWIQADVVAYRGAVGLFAYKAGDRAFVCDYHGLADPYASRLELSSVDGNGVWHSGRGKPGHEKRIRNDWCIARTAVSLEGRPPGLNARDVQEALGCDELADLTAAVREPMSWRRFRENVRLAPELTRLRIPQDILEARNKFCHRPQAAPVPVKLRRLERPEPAPDAGEVP